MQFKKIPTTQYLGSKQKLIDWIIGRLPKFDSAFDAFSGSAVVSYHLKRMNKRIISNDFLKSSYLYAKALIENNNITLSVEDIKNLFKENKNKNDYIEMHFSDVFYTKEECCFLDNLYANINQLDDEYKQAIVFAAMIRTCIQKMPGGKFRNNILKYRDKNFKHFRPKYARDISITFRKFLIGYNNAVFNNGKQNKSYNEDVFNILPNMNVDLAYFDPPYGGSGFNYEKDYFFAELITKYYGKINKFNGKTKIYDIIREGGFNKKIDLEKNFDRLFNAAQHIPIWIISYNNRSIPKLGHFTELIKKYKNIKSIHERPYRYRIGNSEGLKEMLFICQ